LTIESCWLKITNPSAKRCQAWQ